MDATRLGGYKSYRVLVRLGLISYGLVHVVTAVLALQVAFGVSVTASSGGALRAVARRPVGVVVVWSMAIGLLVLSLWQVMEAGLDHRQGLRWTRRLSALGRAATYATLGLLALGAILRAGQPTRVDDTATARLLDLGLGRFLIGAIGLAVAAVGVAQIVRAIRRQFRRDLSRAAGRPTVVFGVVGFTVKGLVLVLIGALLVVAGATHNASDVGGMDVALAQLRRHRFGGELLGAIAAGLACFGLYCFVWSGRARF